MGEFWTIEAGEFSVVITKRFIIYRDWFARARGNSGLSGVVTDRNQVDPLRLTLALKRRYGNRADFYLDDEVDQARANISAIPSVRGPEDIAVYVDPRSGIHDYGIMDSLKNVFRIAKVKVVKDSATIIPAGNIIVIAGHKDESFREFVSKLAERGALSGKIVLLMSCFQGGDENFNSGIIGPAGKARGVIFFPDAINPYAVRQVLEQLAGELPKLGTKGAELSELIGTCIEKTLSAYPEGEDFRNLLKELQRGVLQVSSLESARFTATTQGLSRRPSGLTRGTDHG